jgi:hypothetical protein
VKLGFGEEALRFAGELSEHERFASLVTDFVDGDVTLQATTKATAFCWQINGSVFY